LLAASSASRIFGDIAVTGDEFLFWDVANFCAENVPDDSSRSRFPMISSSPSTMVFFVDLVLTGEFASLDEPTDASRVVRIIVSLPTDLILLDLKGELNPMIRCKN
jgi:hypothetical protein